VGVLDPHRLEQPDTRDRVRPEERVPGERVSVEDGEIQVAAVQRTLGQPPADVWPATSEHPEAIA